MARLTFEERNKNYLKVGNVPQNIIKKYKNILPNELITIWEKMGFGIYEDGFIQLINPDEYDFVFDYVDKLLEPSIVWAIANNVPAVYDVLPARIRALRSKDQGWQNVPEQRRGN
ncbi:MAG: hypothetical protein LBI57_03200, partial [Helicobacteraceae bacterium]|nr:hypothetical protein [Helicobacteraceae bacterium]